MKIRLNSVFVDDKAVFQSVADRMHQSGMERGVNNSYDCLDELLAKMKKDKIKI